MPPQPDDTTLPEHDPSETPPPLPTQAFDATESPRAEADLTCDECGAPLRWSPTEGALACQHCGARRTVAVDDATIEERPLSAASTAARGFGRDVRVMACETCGARVTFEGPQTSSSCPFCGSPNVLAQDANRNQIRPESLIPLEVGREHVEEAFVRWLHRLWFRPNALKKTRGIEAIGVYVPAWTFDARVHSSWSAESGTYYYVTETYTTVEDGKPVTRTRQVRKVRWWPSWGDRRDVFDDLLVVASRGIDDGLAKKLGPFEADGLVPYSPEYLAGWRAEEYRIDLAEGWDLGRAEMEAIQRSRCAGDVPGDTHRHLRVKNEISDVRWKHVLLPMWSVTYTFRGKSYAVLVNGQSGRIVGHAPYSWVKILLLVLAIAGAAAAIAIVAQAS